MAAGDVKLYGTATVPAGTPGAAGSIAVASAGVLATDRIIATISDVAEQDLSGIKREDITFQIIKSAGVGFTVQCNQKQNPSFKVDYMSFAGA